jgi:hypothetical protein
MPSWSSADVSAIISEYWHFNQPERSVDICLNYLTWFQGYAKPLVLIVLSVTKSWIMEAMERLGDTLIPFWTAHSELDTLMISAISKSTLHRIQQKLRDATVSQCSLVIEFTYSFYRHPTTYHISWCPFRTDRARPRGHTSNTPQHTNKQATCGSISRCVPCVSKSSLDTTHWRLAYTENSIYENN